MRLVGFYHEDLLLLEYDTGTFEKVTILAGATLRKDHIDLVANAQHDPWPCMRLAKSIGIHISSPATMGGSKNHVVAVVDEPYRVRDKKGRRKIIQNRKTGRRSGLWSLGGGGWSLQHAIARSQ